MFIQDEDSVVSQSVSDGGPEYVYNEGEAKDEDEDPVDNPDQVEPKEDEDPAKVAEKEDGEGVDLEAKPKEGEEGYKPDFNYKSYDQNKEIPEWARSIVKDKESETQVRELFSKADAFPVVKEKLETTRQERDEFKDGLDKVVGSVNELEFFLQNDLQTFFERVNISDEKLISFVKQKIALQDMSPDQVANYNKSRQTLVDNYQVNQQASSLATQNQQLVKNQFEFAYQQALSLPEVANFRQVFDERMGEGAFRRHADQFGTLKFHETNVNISPVEAIRHVMNTYQGLLGNGQQQSNQTGEPDLASVRRERERSKPGGHIPNVGRGQTVSPTKARARTIDQLRKNVNEMLEANS